MCASNGTKGYPRSCGDDLDKRWEVEPYGSEGGEGESRLKKRDSDASIPNGLVR